MAAPLQTAPEEEPARRTPRDLRAMVWDGAAFSIMVGLGETYVPVFALAAGFGPGIAGWLTTLPLVAGGLLALLTPFGVARLGSYRRWVITCAALQAVSFGPLVLAALHERVPLGLLFACATLYWAGGMAASSAWNDWADALVPVGRRARFFAYRARWGQAALLAAVLVGGFALEVQSPSTQGVGAFAALFGAAALARIVSGVCLSLQSDVPDRTLARQGTAPWHAWRRLRGSEAERLLRYLLAVQVAVNLAAPFFTPYMLDTLALSYGHYTLLTAAAFAARIAFLPLIGQVAQARGNRFVLWVGALGVAPLPALWLVSDSFAWLLALQVVAGAAWACLELSTLLSFFEVLKPGDRTSVLTAFNLANAVAMSLGALGGGWLLRTIGPDPATYGALFLVSTLGRLASLAFLRRVTVPEVPLQGSALRTIAVRPSVGALQRPVLAALPTRQRDPHDDDPAASNS